jgi:TRAP-type uncharacterized transport system fused permease subunit
MTALMQKHVVLTAVGLLLSLLVLAWVRPNTSAGASLLILTIIVVVNAIGVVVMRRSPPTRKKRYPKGMRKPGKIG